MMKYVQKGITSPLSTVWDTIEHMRTGEFNKVIKEDIVSLGTLAVLSFTCFKSIGYLATSRLGNAYLGTINLNTFSTVTKMLSTLGILSTLEVVGFLQTDRGEDNNSSITDMGKDKEENLEVMEEKLKQAQEKVKEAEHNLDEAGSKVIEVRKLAAESKQKFNSLRIKFEEEQATERFNLAMTQLKAAKDEAKTAQEELNMVQLKVTQREEAQVEELVLINTEESNEVTQLGEATGSNDHYNTYFD